MLFSSKNFQKISVFPLTALQVPPKVALSFDNELPNAYSVLALTRVPGKEDT